MTRFREERIGNWDKLLTRIASLSAHGRWVFRGQLGQYGLKTGLERACENAGIPLTDAPAMELEMIREFRRWYDGNDRETVCGDTLYCLALMQHHGAPTRLLDWTYSAYVALYFALESAQDHGPGPSRLAVWCLHQDWCYKQAKLRAGVNRLHRRRVDRQRTDQTFQALYMAVPPVRLVFLENPYSFHPRLFLQQGVFLCPGDVSVSFESNVRALQGWDTKEAVVKICCTMDASQRVGALEELRRMNIYRGILFPDLDGFAEGMKYRLGLYNRLVGWRRRYAK